MKSGFTLVELAIVVVVLGILVIGIVGAQSIIKSANVRSIVSEFNGLNTAINAFNLEYGKPPGDFDEGHEYWGDDCHASPTHCNGDGDGKIEHENGEYNLAWRHFYFSEIYTPSCQECFAKQRVTVTIGRHSPTSNFSEFHGWNLFNSNQNGASPYSGKNFLLLGRNASNSLLSRGFTPRFAETIDKKIDDGKSYKGRFTGYYPFNNYCNNNSSDREYNLESEIEECGLFYKIDMQ
jgi:prepilin-type N-terminal cleavage/methylation domain-containing protein